ncbi:hypothetical protein SAMN05216579_4057 [Pseudomonas granadensis]|nr:hypothetical protein SAMN05216579_4057 [Pseudomonas granadensis]
MQGLFFRLWKSGLLGFRMPGTQKFAFNNRAEDQNSKPSTAPRDKDLLSKLSTIKKGLRRSIF